MAIPFDEDDIPYIPEDFNGYKDENLYQVQVVQADTCVIV